MYAVVPPPPGSEGQIPCILEHVLRIQDGVKLLWLFMRRVFGQRRDMHTLCPLCFKLKPCWFGTSSKISHSSQMYKKNWKLGASKEISYKASLKFTISYEITILNTETNLNVY